MHILKIIPPLLLAAILTAAPLHSAAEPGPVVLIGGVLRNDNQPVWERIVGLAGGQGAKFVVFPTATGRPNIYGRFAVRALRQHGALAELVPVSPKTEAIGMDYRKAVQDEVLLAKVENADGVFFTGGAPQYISRTLYNPDGSNTPMLASIRKIHATGGVIAGANAGHAVLSTGISAPATLKDGLPEQAIQHGLGLLPDSWFIDQHYFVHGRFALSLVAMRKLSLQHGIGVGINAAVVIQRRQAEVIGDGGAMIVDLSHAEISGGSEPFALKKAKLNYLGNGDRVDLDNLQITPHSSKLEGFTVNPNAGDFEPWFGGPAVYDDIFARPALTNMIFSAIDGEQKQGVGLAPNGFKFRCYPGRESFGWSSKRNNYTAINIYLDVIPP